MITKHHQPCLDAALAYLRRDWSVVALCPPGHQGVPDYHRCYCRQPGKRPLGRWKEWQTRLPTVDELVEQWEMVPLANVGVVLGPVSGIIGIDIDGAEGERILEEVVSQGDLPRTLSFSTGRGRRLLYALPANCRVRTRSYRDGQGEVKILAHGSLTVMPPSRHISGKKYRWLPRRGPDHLEPAPAPDWVVGRVADHRPGQRRSIPIEPGAPIPEGRRNETLFRLACAMRRHGCTPSEILCTLRSVNRRCVPQLDERELPEVARSASRYTPALSIPCGPSTLSSLPS
jgi:putative DNA primase/helicase